MRQFAIPPTIAALQRLPRAETATGFAIAPLPRTCIALAISRTHPAELAKQLNAMANRHRIINWRGKHND